MNLEGITVCVGYEDFLADTLPLNLRHFDRFLVVTSPEDKGVQRICRYYDVPFVLTDVFRSRWGEFHKAKGINMGLKQLDLNDWVVHMDADVVLPPTTRKLLDQADLDKTLLYGADRYQVRGYDVWRTHQAMPWLQQDNYRVHMDLFPIAPRFSGARMGGYAPPGYFQLWHPRSSNAFSYPEEHNHAGKTDVLFTAKWWRSGRQLLPEFVVYHLESEAASQGANWSGRITKRWGPSPDEQDVRHPRNHVLPPVHQGPPATPAMQQGYGHPPKGKKPPHWHGVLKVGRELSADAGTWDGDPPITFAYQWERREARHKKRHGWQLIRHAREAVYTIVHADLHCHLRVVVTARNHYGAAVAESIATPVITH